MKKPVELGKYIVADPEICHGAVTFRGTRLLVADALELLAGGLSPAEVCKQLIGIFRFSSAPDFLRPSLQF